MLYEMKLRERMRGQRQEYALSILEQQEQTRNDNTVHHRSHELQALNWHRSTKMFEVFTVLICCCVTVVTRCTKR